MAAIVDAGMVRGPLSPIDIVTNQPGICSACGPFRAPPHLKGEYDAEKMQMALPATAK
jgi:hypothetical protein